MLCNNSSLLAVCVLEACRSKIASVIGVQFADAAMKMNEAGALMSGIAIWQAGTSNHW